MSHLRHRAVPQLLALKVQYKLPGNGPGPTQALRSSVHLGVTLLVFLAMPQFTSALALSRRPFTVQRRLHEMCTHRGTCFADLCVCLLCIEHTHTMCIIVYLYIYILYTYFFLKYACARKHSAHTRVDGLLFSTCKPKWNFLPSRACGPLATTMRFGINKQFGFSTGRSRSRPSVPQNRLLSLFLTLWKHTLSGLRNALIPSNSVGHEQFEDLGLSGFSAAGGPKIMSFDEKGDQGPGFEVSNLERKTVVSHHPSGNIREGSRCPSLLSATTSAASFNDLSSLFKEDLRKGGKIRPEIPK